MAIYGALNMSFDDVMNPRNGAPARPGLNQPQVRSPSNPGTADPARAPRPQLDQTPSGLAARIPDERGANSIDPRERQRVQQSANWGGETLSRPAPQQHAAQVQNNPAAPSGVQGGALYNSFDLRASNAALARANAIRGAGQPEGPRAGAIGSGREDSPFARWNMEAAMQNPNLTRSQREQMTELYLKPQQWEHEAGMNNAKEGGALSRAMLDAQSRRDTTDMEGRTRLEQEGVRGRYALQEADARGQWGMAQQGLQNAGAYDQARYNADQRGSTALQSGADRIFQSFIQQGDMQGAEKFRQQLLAEMAGRREQTFAEGGLVQAQQALPEVNEYRDYAMGARQLGLPAVPFEKFLSLRAGARQPQQAVQPYSAMGFANGGEIPDPQAVAGKMVVDTDPNAPTDSIPAVIDGEQPAKLDSGEFVLPDDVVKFFGTDKLNKMIAQARAGQQPQE